MKCPISAKSNSSSLKGPSILKTTNPKPFRFQTDERNLLKASKAERSSNQVMGKEELINKQAKKIIRTTTATQPFRFRTEERSYMRAAQAGQFQRLKDKELVVQKQRKTQEEKLSTHAAKKKAGKRVVVNERAKVGGAKRAPSHENDEIIEMAAANNVCVVVNEITAVEGAKRAPSQENDEIIEMVAAANDVSSALMAREICSDVSRNDGHQVVVADPDALSSAVLARTYFQKDSTVLIAEMSELRLRLGRLEQQVHLLGSLEQQVQLQDDEMTKYECKVETLLTEMITLSAHLDFLQKGRTCLIAEMNELRLPRQGLEQQVHLQHDEFFAHDVLHERVQHLELETSKIMVDQMARELCIDVSRNNGHQEVVADADPLSSAVLVTTYFHKDRTALIAEMSELRLRLGRLEQQVQLLGSLKQQVQLQDDAYFGTDFSSGKPPISTNGVRNSSARNEVRYMPLGEGNESKQHEDAGNWEQCCMIDRADQCCITKDPFDPFDELPESYLKNEGKESRLEEEEIVYWEQCCMINRVEQCVTIDRFDPFDELSTSYLKNGRKDSKLEEDKVEIVCWEKSYICAPLDELKESKQETKDLRYCLENPYLIEPFSPISGVCKVPSWESWAIKGYLEKPGLSDDTSALCRQMLGWIAVDGGFTEAIKLFNKEEAALFDLIVDHYLKCLLRHKYRTGLIAEMSELRLRPRSLEHQVQLQDDEYFDRFDPFDELSTSYLKNGRKESKLEEDEVEIVCWENCAPLDKPMESKQETRDLRYCLENPYPIEPFSPISGVCKAPSWESWAIKGYLGMPGLSEDTLALCRQMLGWIAADGGFTDSIKLFNKEEAALFDVIVDHYLKCLLRHKDGTGLIAEMSELRLRPRSLEQQVQLQDDEYFGTGFSHSTPALSKTKNPPAGEEKVVLYLTTLRGVRKTFEECSLAEAVC